jgi:hypothetical protein
MSDDLLLTLPDDEHPDTAATAAAGEAHAHATRGDWTAAERLFDEARGAASRARDEVAVAVALTNRGHALARLGRLEEAALTLDAALEARRRLHAAGVAGEAVVARGLADVAAVAAALGDPSEAARLLRRAREHAEAGGASDVVRAIDERLAGARALGAADEEMVVEETVVEAPVVETHVFEAPTSEVDTFEVDTFEVDTFEAPSFDAPTVEVPAAERPALEVPELEPTTFESAAFEPTAFEPTAFEETAFEPAAFEAAAIEPSGFEPTLLDAPAFDAPAELDALPLDVPDEDDAPSDGPALTFLDAEPLTAPTPTQDEEPADAWSLADPSPFEGLEADAVHRQAVALDTKPEGHPAIEFEPTALGSADAMSALDDEPDAAIPPVPEFPEVYESPLGEGPEPTPEPVAEPVAETPAPRRRTTRDVPLVAPPEQKRPWWRRLTPGGRG